MISKAFKQKEQKSKVYVKGRFIYLLYVYENFWKMHTKLKHY